MRATTLGAAAMAASLVSAGVIQRRSGSYVQAVYWGQEPDGDERSLGEYCATGQGIDIIILSFLDSFGDGTYPNGYLGDCSINSDGSSDGCESLETDIGTCQSNGVKVFMSIGGGGAPWQLSGTGDAQGVAYSLWNSYANPDVTSDSARPLGDVSIDGWDLDIESDPNGASAYLQDLVDALRGYFSSDSSKSYYISGAPQCPLPIADMDAVIKNSQFDYLFIQFYNNNCAAAELTDPSGNNPDGNGQYNFNAWPGYLSGTASANAQLLVGLPASTTAADTAFFFIQPSDLPQLISNSQSVAGFNGVMLWDAGSSDTTNDNGCNYAQEVRSVLDTGSPC